MGLEALLAIVLTAAGQAIVPGAATAAPAPVTASAPAPKVRVVVKAPSKVAATVTVTGKPRRVVAKRAGTKAITRTYKVRRGRHTVLAEAVMTAGRIYAPTVSRKSFTAVPGMTTKVVVRYAAVKGAPVGLEVTQLEPGQVGLAWQGGSGSKLALRRTHGTVPAATHSDGTRVPVGATTATDSSVTAGRPYTYALFARVQGRWSGPLTTTVGTPEETPSGRTTTYLAAEGTELLAKRAVTVLGHPRGGLTVKVDGDPVALGQVLVLPISPALPSGYIGKVSAIAPDGTISLIRAAIGEAFDYFKFDIPQFGTGFVDAKHTAPAADPAAGDPTAARRATLPSCLSGALSSQVSVDDDLKLSGYSKGEIIRKKLKFLPDPPVGATLEGRLQVDLRIAVGVDVKGSIACGLDIKPISKTFMAGPVPMALVFDPTAEVSISGTLAVSNVGLQAKGGVEWDVAFGAGVDDRADGRLIHEADALTPTATAKGAVGLTLGGSLTFGPGAVEKDAGVVAGVKGNLDLLNAEAAVLRVAEPDDPTTDTCIKLSAGGSAGLSLTAKAWLGQWEEDATFDVPGMKGPWSYGDPWYWPEDCDSPNKDDVYIVTVDEEGSDTATVAAALEGLGYNVDSGPDMPEFPADYGQIWVFGTYTSYSASLVAALEDYIEDGGSAFVNGEHSCCSGINTSLESLMDSLLSVDVGVVTACTQPCVRQVDPLNPGAFGDIANNPNRAVSVLTDALGYYSGVPEANQLLVQSGYVGGTVWGPEHMAEGKGRLVTLSDSNWSDASRFAGNNEQFTANVAKFLRG